MKDFRLVLFFTIFIISSCSSEPICLYNPSDQSITVDLDDEKYKLNPGDTIEISISKGEFNLKTYSGNDQILATTIVVSDSLRKNGGYINPTKQPLYLITEKFTNSSLFNFGEHPRALFNLCDININSLVIDKDSLALDLMEEEGFIYSPETDPTLLIDCFLLIGEIKTYQKHIIVKEWDYGINTDMPSSLFHETYEGLEMLGVHKSKICDKSYLIDYYKTNYKIYKRLFPDEI